MCVCVCLFPLPFFSQFHPCRCRVYVFSRFMISVIAILQPAAVAAADASRAACLSKVDDKMAIKRRSLPSARSVPSQFSCRKTQDGCLLLSVEKKNMEKKSVLLGKPVHSLLISVHWAFPAHPIHPRDHELY